MGSSDGSVFLRAVGVECFCIFVAPKSFTKSIKGFDTGAGTDTLEQSQHTVRRVNTNTTTGSGDFVMTLSNVNETFLSDTDLSNYTLKQLKKE